MKSAKALVLALTLCMLTTSLVGGTVARFRAEDSTRDTAQVTQWGVVLSVSGDLFGTNYLGAAGGNTATSGDTNVTVRSDSVSALDASFLKVVAPGTKGQGMTLMLSGTSEVATRQRLGITTQNIYLAKGIYGEMAPVANVTADNIEALIAEGLYVDSNEGISDQPSYQKLTVKPADLNGITFYRVEDRFELTADYYPVVYTAKGLGGVASDIHSDSLASIALALAESVARTDVDEAAPDAFGKRSYSVAGPRLAAGTKLDMGLDPLAVASVERLTLDWTWAIDNGGSDAERALCRSADSLLGHLSPANRTLVLLDADGKASLLTVNAESGLIKNAVGVLCGSLKTSLDVSLLIEQID